MSIGNDTTWVGKKPLRRLGGMYDALSIAADLGYTVPPPPSQVQKKSTLLYPNYRVKLTRLRKKKSKGEDSQRTEEDIQNSSTVTGEKGNDLIRVLRELTAVQRKIADLQVEFQGRKEDKNVAHLTHVSEMEKKIETLAMITIILKDVIQNKDRIIARLQQPYSLDCIPVEAEYQKQFLELLMKVASDYGALTASVADFQWSQNFRQPPSVWGEMLRPIPVALASCTRFFEAMSAMRESFSTLQSLRVVSGHSFHAAAATPPAATRGDLDCVTPHWKSESRFDDFALQETEDGLSEVVVGDNLQSDGTSQRRLSWPPSLKNSPG